MPAAAIWAEPAPNWRWLIVRVSLPKLGLSWFTRAVGNGVTEARASLSHSYAYIVNAFFQYETRYAWPILRYITYSELTQWFMFDVDSSHIRHAMGHIAAYPQLLLLLSHLPSWGSTPSGCLYCRSPYLWYLPWFLVSPWCAAGLLLSAVPAGDIDRQRRLMGAAPQHGTQQQIALSSICAVTRWRLT